MFVLATPATGLTMHVSRFNTFFTIIAMFICHSVFASALPAFSTVLVTNGDPEFTFVTFLIAAVIGQINSRKW